MKKGRHRRYEEARALKRTSDDLDDLFADNEQPCDECGVLPGHDHKSWCERAGTDWLATGTDGGSEDSLFPS